LLFKLLLYPFIEVANKMQSTFMLAGCPGNCLGKRPEEMSREMC